MVALIRPKKGAPMRISAACLIGMLAFPCLAKAECVGPNAPLTVEGELAIGNFHDAADRPESALILTMATPIYLSGPEEDDNVEPTRKLHVYGADTATQRRLRNFVGKGVRLTGEVFVAHTAHQHAPIVMDVKRAE
jgi:hypothetical protein